MQDRNRLSTLNHYCQQDSQTTTQDTDDRPQEEKGSTRPSVVTTTIRQLSTWVASRVVRFFLPESQDTQTTLQALCKASQNLRHAPPGLSVLVLQDMLYLARKPRCHSTVSHSLFEAALPPGCQPRGNSTVFFLLLRPEEAAAHYC
jgi:hypothetical protein